MSNPPAALPVHEPCEGCSDLLDVTSFGPFETVICPLCSVETPVKRDFGTYRLQQRYATGGMSVIFVGHDTTLDRKVAIKVLNEEYCNDEIRIQAFENEARLTAQVSHPNVVKIYAVGRAYGRFYLVMELLEGRSFERIMSKRGAIPEKEVLEIATQVASGLQAAKEAGMIHRDVKPGNILIAQDGRARLVDFGLALITQDGHAQAEEVWATPFYVPPEALERGIEDFRSDIYAFGATLYHALAGRPPFETTSTSNSVLRKAKQTIPPLCQVAEWVTPRTGKIVDRMMAFKQEHRWGSYKEVIEALENAHRNIGQIPATPIHSKPRRKRRKNGGKVGIILALALIALTTGLALWKPWEKKTSSTSPLTPNITAESPAVFDPSASTDQNIIEAWKSARSAIAQGHFKEATQRFRDLSENKNIPKTSRAWAAFEGTAAAFLNGTPKRARNLANQTAILLKDADQKNPGLKKIRNAGHLLHRIQPPSPKDAPNNPKTIAGAMRTFTIALKLWEQSQWEASLPLFAAVRSSPIPDHFDWFQRYQTIADIYLADGQILSSLKGLPLPKNTAEASSQFDQLNRALQSIQTKGRASYNIRARQARLVRLRKTFEQ